MSDKKLTGKVAVITGASKGLGKAMAIALGAAGARIAIASRDVKLSNETAAAVRAAGADAEVFRADVMEEQQVLKLEKDVIARFDRVHILINNAGINVRKPIGELSLDEWNRMIQTNLTAAFLMSRSFVPHMKGQGYGRIINMTSIMSHVALPGRSGYCASKAGLLAFTKVLAIELADDGITVNGISPGPFATEMNQVILQNPELSKEFLSKIPLRRFGKVEEIGQLAVYLCSEEAGFITGTDLLIDGGWCAQ